MHIREHFNIVVRTEPLILLMYSDTTWCFSSGRSADDFACVPLFPTSTTSARRAAVSGAQQNYYLMKNNWIPFSVMSRKKDTWDPTKIVKAVIHADELWPSHELYLL